MNEIKKQEILLRDNDKIVINILLVQSSELGLQRDIISDISNIARSTVFVTLVRLEGLKIVYNEKRKESIGRGRPGTFWILSENYRQNTQTN